MTRPPFPPYPQPPSPDDLPDEPPGSDKPVYMIERVSILTGERRDTLMTLTNLPMLNRCVNALNEAAAHDNQPYLYTIRKVNDESDHDWSSGRYMLLPDGDVD